MAELSKLTLPNNTTYYLRDRNYGTCTTAAGTAAKVATLEGFTLITGSVVHINFTNTNTIANPTLNVNETGAYAIKKYGSTAAGTTADTSWYAGSVVTLVYDGTYWVMADFNVTGMYIASYGNSTYDEVLEAYQDNKIIYCRASSNNDPATGNQLRMAFLAYINNQTTPTEFEFQYYRSVATHSNTQQGDQVFVYKLKSASGWEVSTRQAYTKIINGTGLSGSYASGALTLNHSNSVTAQTTQAIYPIKIDAQGHINSYGSAVTPLTADSTLDATKLSGAVPRASLPSNAEMGQGYGEVDSITRTGKNMLPYPYEDTTKTTNGITFTDNGDGTITANGTVDSGYNAVFVLADSPLDEINPSGNSVILSGCPEGGSSSTYCVYCSVQAIISRDYGSGVNFAHSINYAAIIIYSDTTVNNLTFSPMIRLATESADWEAYNGPEVSVTLPSYELSEGGIVAIKTNNEITRGASLNINDTGTKQIFNQLRPLKDNEICSGDTATFIYSNNIYHLLSVDRWQNLATPSSPGLMSASDKDKLNTVARNANNYSLPTASANILGGVKVGTNLSISSGVLSATDTTYSDATTSDAGLMSAADKTKLDGIEAGANAYTLPVASSSAYGGIKVGNNLSITDGVLNYTLPMAKADTLGGIKVGTNLSINASTGVLSATDTTYSAATQSAAGLMSAADKKKLDGVATGANAYSLPTASASALGGIKVGTNLSINASTGVLSATNTTYSNATTSAAGLMSAADKTKLNGIATGANAYSLPTASSSTLGGIKVGSHLAISGGVLSGNYGAATTSAAGLMSAADKTKLNAITPYPTSYGTSGNWRRLDFSNKLMIQWCTQSVTINVTSAWGGGYEGRLGYWNFAWAFNATPTIIASLQSCSGGACILEYTGAGSATGTQTYYAWRPTSASNITVTVGIIAIGTHS